MIPKNSITRSDARRTANCTAPCFFVYHRENSLTALFLVELHRKQEQCGNSDNYVVRERKSHADDGSVPQLVDMQAEGIQSFYNKLKGNDKPRRARDISSDKHNECSPKHRKKSSIRANRS